MTMKGNNTDYQFDPNGGNGGGSFQEHDERMRECRRSHADVALVNGLRLTEAALIESMEPLRVRCARIETGGSQLLSGKTGWSTLIPLLKIAGYKLSQN